MKNRKKSILKHGSVLFLQKRTRWHLFILVLGFGFSCSTPTTQKKCQYGTPQAIFQANTPTVTTHQFDLYNKTTASEKIVFDNGKELVITQAGCDVIEQELVFRLKNKKISGDPELFALAIQNLDDLGKLADNLKPFSFWAQAIYNKHTELRKGLEVEVEQRTYASIDLIEEGQDALVRVVLTRK